MSEPIHILYVDDHPVDRELVRYALVKEHGGFRVTEATSRADFEARLAEGYYDLVLSDVNILGFDGLQVLDAVRAKNPRVPVIIVTATGSEEVAVEAMKRGAADYVIKTARHIKRLPATIQAVLEKKRLAEVGPRESEELFRAMTALSPASIAILRSDEQGEHFLYVNAAWETLTGYPRDEAMPLRPNDLIYPDMRARLAEQASARIRGEDVPSRYEIKIITKKGEIRWLDFAAVVIRYQGAPAILTIGFDVTEGKQAESGLRESEVKYRSLVDQSLFGIIIVQGGRIRYANKMIAEKGGYSPDELMSLPPTKVVQLIHPEDREIVWNRMLSRLSGKQEPARNECRLLTKDGAVYWADIHTNVIEYSGKPAVQLCIVDTTERKLAEEALRHSEAQLSNAMNIAKLGYWEFDVAENMFNFDDHFYAIFQTSAEQVGGYKMSPARYAELFLHPDDRSIVAAEIKNALETTDPHYSCQLEHRIIYADGEIGYISVRFFVVKDDQGRTIKTYGANQDITERKQAEAEREKLQAQLNQAQKMEAVGRLAGGVAHDYNNILSVIIGYSELAMDKVVAEDPLREDLNEIHSAANRSRDITRQLLAFARKETITPEVLDLNATVETMFNILRKLIGEDIELVWHPGKVPGPVLMDPSQLDQILANLCINARDAIANVGRITIETGTETIDVDYCSEHAEFIPGEFVLLVVSDDGCGMDRETVDHIFEPFFTTKGVGKGTGLGLSTVYGIVKQNNGYINVYSKPGRGTTFRIYLPRHPSDISGKQRSIDEQVINGSGETVLVVEDEMAILKLAERILSRYNYKVLLAKSPSEALEVAQAHSGEISLLLTDVVMPEMNGRELANQLKILCPGIKCLFMSGYTANVIAHRGVFEEGVQFIQKPFSTKGLAAKVRKALEKKTK